MAELFQDSFVEASDTDLINHTPNTGTGWTLITGSATGAFIESTDNTLRSRSTVKTLTASDDLGITQYYVEGELTEVNSKNIRHVVIRAQDEDNYIGWSLSGNGGAGMRLVKVIAGVTTDLILIQGVAGSTYRIEVDVSTVKFFEDGIQQGSNVTVTEFQAETMQGVVTSSSSSGDPWLNNYAAGSLTAGGVSIPVIMNSYRQRRV